MYERAVCSQYVYKVNYAVLGKTGKASVTQLVSSCMNESLVLTQLSLKQCACNLWHSVRALTQAKAKQQEQSAVSHSRGDCLAVNSGSRSTLASHKPSSGQRTSSLDLWAHDT